MESAASLVRIEQQLTEGDENNDTDDRRKKYGREGRFQHAFSVPSPASSTQCDSLCKPAVFVGSVCTTIRQPIRQWGPRAAFATGRRCPLGLGRPEALTRSAPCRIC